MTALTANWASDALQKVIDTALIALPETSAEAAESNDEIALLAEKLGLERQADRYKKGGSTIPHAFASYRLSDDEVQVWARFCPTHYIEGSDAFRQYSFDTPPVPVLTHWALLKENYPWDHFEIWTTEKTKSSDPLLIGVFEGVRYLLARWGKEAPDLISYAEVRERVCAELRNFFTIEELPEKVAAAIRGIQFKSLTSVSRMSHWNNGRFFFRKHCKTRMLAFSLWGSPGVFGLCPVCGASETVGFVTCD